MKRLSPIEIDGFKAAALHAQKQLAELLKCEGSKECREHHDIRDRLDKTSTPPDFQGKELYTTKLRGALAVRFDVLKAAINVFKDGGHANALSEFDMGLYRKVSSLLSC
jgi:hypothetical protein